MNKLPSSLSLSPPLPSPVSQGAAIFHGQENSGGICSMALDGAAKTRASMSLHHVRESGGGAMEERLRLSVTIAQPQGRDKNMHKARSATPACLNPMPKPFA